MATLYPIPENTEAGTPFFIDAPDVAVTGVEQSLLSFTVPVSTTRRLHQARVTCAWDGTFTAKLNGSVIGQGRTGPSDRNAPFFWTPSRPISAGDEFELVFKGAQGVPIGMKVGASLMAADF